MVLTPSFEMKYGKRKGKKMEENGRKKGKRKKKESVQLIYSGILVLDEATLFNPLFPLFQVYKPNAACASLMPALFANPFANQGILLRPI